MPERRDYGPFDRFSERWPTKGDRIFSPGRDAAPAEGADERAYRLGKGYKLAGDVLVQNLAGDPRDHYDLIYPILFCYRHYIEIALKEIITEYGPWVGIALSQKDHKLPELWALFVEIAVAFRSGDASDDATMAVAACIDELVEVDPASVAFRYARDRRTENVIPLKFGTINLVNLHDVMNGIQNFFECATLEFDHKKDCTTEDAETSWFRPQ